MSDNIATPDPDERDLRDVLAEALLADHQERLRDNERDLLRRVGARADFRARLTERRLALRVTRRALGLGEPPREPPNLTAEEMESFLMTALCGDDDE